VTTNIYIQSRKPMRDDNKKCKLMLMRRATTSVLAPRESVYNVQ